LLVPNWEGDKFILVQCHKNYLQQKQMEAMVYAYALECIMYT